GNADRAVIPGSMKLKRPIASATFGLANARKRRTRSSGSRDGAGRTRNPSLALVMMSADYNAPMRPLPSIAVLALLSAMSLAQSPATAPYRDPQRPIGARVSDLLSRMTLEGKIWQMLMISGQLC